jgi:hypothetical protein
MSSSIIEDPTSYIVQYSEKTKYSCTMLGVSLLLVLLFFVSPLAVKSGSITSSIIKIVIICLLVATSAILFEAVKPIINTDGILDTDLFPDLKFNFFITAGFVLLIVVLGIVVIRLYTYLLLPPPIPRLLIKSSNGHR